MYGTQRTTIARILWSTLLVIGCSESQLAPASDDPDIAVHPASATLQVGGTRQFTATFVTSTSGQSNPWVTWESSDTMVAVVSASGMVTAVEEGTATITATSRGKSGSAPGQSRKASGEVIVVEPQPTVASVAVSPASASIGTGHTTRLTAEARDASGNVLTGRSIIWSSTNMAVATVDTSGTVRALAAGTTTITAAIDAQTGTAGISVNAPVARTGTLSVTINGVASGAANGGTLSRLRTDIAGQVSTNVTVPVSGSVTLTLEEGTYRLTYAAPAGHQLVAGEVNPKQAAIVADQTSSLSFAVEVTPAPPPPPPPPSGEGVVFRSDFSAALGTSATALLDGGRWHAQVGNGRANAVIASTGLDFPTANVLAVRADNSGGGTTIPAQNIGLEHERSPVPEPAIGGSVFYRWIIRVTVPDSYTADDSTHPIEDATSSGGYSGSATNWMQRVQTRSDGTWLLRWDVGQGARNVWPNNLWTSPPLRKHVTYRIELQVHRVSETSFNLHTRVYDSSGALVAGDAQFTNVNGSATLASTPLLVGNDGGNRGTWTQKLGGIQAGLNGLAGWPAGTQSFTLYYQAAFCIRMDTWCGPYSGGI